MVQFNGHFGCAYCLQEGQSVATGRGQTWVYTYDNINGFEERTHEGFCLDGHLAAEQNKNIRGIKGHSWLIYVPHFNIINGMAVDYMHCVFLGIVRKLLRLWFDSEFSKEDFLCTS
ncbi:hypothetical protein HOLleu_42111 [Holothuria leucospilota]|uniref:Uncharacterized protein n=1 Tax=Holothuria leucospilota TaxID=206669 RepID=A0A9Q0YB73_HOLLE|nr:hypothetical protein HOLleu_42111 [Holothuria leucospilota]